MRGGLLILAAALALLLTKRALQDHFDDLTDWDGLDDFPCFHAVGDTQ